MQSLQRKFKGKEAEVVEVVRLSTIEEVMKRYGIKTKRSFMKWLLAQPSVPPLSKNRLAGLSGGEKAKLHREHRATILGCLEIFGEEFVMQNFHISTIARLKEIECRQYPPNQRLTKADRAELWARTALEATKELEKKLGTLEAKIEIIAGGERANRKALNELRGLFGKFTETVSSSIGKALIIPLLESLLTVDENLNLPDNANPLNINSLISQAKLCRGSRKVKALRGQ